MQATLPGGQPRRRGLVTHARTCSLLLAWLCVIASSSAAAQRPPITIPAHKDTVLERLPRGYAALLPSSTAELSISRVERLLATAARTGDARLAARAEQLLATMPADSNAAAVIKARAFSAQHRHDFSGAVRLLDGLIASDPRDGEARLARAQIQMVRGQLDRARSDCVALALSVDADFGLLCVAALSLRNGQFENAATVADRWLAQPSSDRGLRRHVLVMRGEIASRAHAVNADSYFKHALELAPDDVRTLAAYARHLHANDRDQDVLQLLAHAPRSDSLQLQHALAAHAEHLPQAPAMIAAQARRYALAHAVGSEPELRDEAEFLLTLRNDPNGALELAKRNFRTQRDVEDVSILQRAAKAADRPDALAPLHAWAKSQQLSLQPLPGDHR